MTFSTTYEESRDSFLEKGQHLKSIWARVDYAHIPLPDAPEVSMDYLSAKPLVPKKMVVLSAGLHGIEGYVGAAMINLFIEQFLHELDPQTTGMTLIHAINPWGMKYLRKANEHNVDLNRNFIWDWNVAADLANPDYNVLRSFFQPKRSGNILFGSKLVQALLQKGAKGVERALTLGQYSEPEGVFYGGATYQFQTQEMIKLCNQIFLEYQQVLFLDLHTGYGPRNSMYFVNSPYERKNAAYWQEKFSYPFVVQTAGAQFYEIHGDMINYLYLLQQHQYPEVQLFASTLEFGTLGDSTLAQIRSLKTTIDENYVYHHSPKQMRGAAKAKENLQALYYPTDEIWRQKAIADAKTAFRGIFKNEL